MKIVIVGAGPTGLGAAARLQALGADWHLYEKEAAPGGLAASFESEGFTWDLGGHIVFSHYPQFTAMLDDCFAPDDWCRHRRNACVRCCDRWIPYPFQNNIRDLPVAERNACLDGLREAAGRSDGATPANFQEWIDRTAGPGIARLFMNPYNFKVWAYPPEQLAAGWLGDRVAVPDPDVIERSFDAPPRRDTWGPNSTFRFPLEGGTGAIWRRLAATLPPERIHYGHPLVTVSLANRQLAFSDGSTTSYDRLINTMPLDEFCAATGEASLAEQAEELCSNTVHVIGFGMHGPPPPAASDKSWLYFPDPAVPFYRVTVFSNYSPHNVPKGHYSLMAEVSESPVKPVNADSLVAESEPALREAGLIGEAQAVCHTWTRRLPKAYPVPTLARDGTLSEANAALEVQNVYSRGRFGAWKYEVGNMDHSYAQGIEIAERLVNDATELTYNHPEIVNAR